MLTLPTPSIVADEDDLVVETLPNGQVAWLRPSTEPAEDDDAFYVLTYEGRRALRWPSCYFEGE